MSRFNLVFVFADQMRADATGYSGNKAVHTPNLDRLAADGQNFRNCISGTPVCTPWRACLLTGQYPLRHGLFINDVRLPTDRPTFGTVLKEAGYKTGYVGKWHLDGNDRMAFTPPGPRRQGFDFWAAANCNHGYMMSHFYRDTPDRLQWPGYDAHSQTDVAMKFATDCGTDPFALFLSWGPPHNPYDQVPRQFMDRYPPQSVSARPNCPNPDTTDLRGYYAHITALDEEIGRLLRCLSDNGQLERTIFVFTSDHGDMLGSHGVFRKQHPWEESIHVPFLIRSPMQFARGANVDALLNVWDLMPTLLSLLDVAHPSTIDDLDLSAAVRDPGFAGPDATLACAIAPFCEYRGSPWRVVRTRRHTYARDLSGPWLLYDNQSDPYQLNNLIKDPGLAPLRTTLDTQLNDDFKPAEEYIRRWGYKVDEGGAIPLVQ